MTTTLDPNASLGRLVTELPSRSRVLEELGLDYCCHGERTLAESCAEKSLDLENVLSRLAAAEPHSDRDSDWTNAPMTQLIEHIVDHHHAFLRRELPRLKELLQKVIAAHGERHPELHEVARLYDHLVAELEPHMMKEEQILFPMLVQLDRSATSIEFHCGSVANPIGVMRHEHDGAGAALSRLAELTDNYAAPADACVSYRALYDGFRELQRDLHEHIHKENNILFPAGIRRTEQLARNERLSRQCD